jgi:hypothetical protein
MGTAPVKVLDASQKQQVSYCIPLWLRDEQIRVAIRKVRARIAPQDLKQEPIAVVCFGPSLKHTWEKIRDFRYTITCSGAHRFLLDRGITPTWHVEVDPRPHKIGLLGDPHPDVEYLPASTCHPDYFDHLLKHTPKVTLWHVFDSSEEAVRVLPRGEWAVTGGCNVGLRAMTIARFFGFREQHVFGMDGCESVYEDGEVGKKHAAPHPLQDGTGHSITVFKDKTYRTTPSLLESARQTFHELDMMSDVQATFYGEGLVQEMAKDYQRKPIPQNQGKDVIAFNRPELISSEYRDQNRILHETNLAYGVGAGRHAPAVLRIIEKTGVKSVLDYGCGKGYLQRALPFPIWEYDPAVPGKEEPPRPADLVCCFDVLEHVEPDKLLYVLDDLRRVITKMGYLTIHTGPAQKKLPDGRNTHLIQKPIGWWKDKLEAFFVVAKIFQFGPELHIIVGPKMARQSSAETFCAAS